MKRIYKSIICLIVISMIFSTFAYAAETRSSDYLLTYSGTLTRTSTGKLCISFDVTGTNTMIDIGASTVRVYKSNGTLMATYYYTSCSSMMGHNTFSHSNSLTYAGTTGESYYCIITFHARNANGYDSKNYVTGRFLL